MFDVCTHRIPSNLQLQDVILRPLIALDWGKFPSPKCKRRVEVPWEEPPI
jgi:hypothetical protein